MKMNLDELFRGPDKTPPVARHRTYDVRVTLNRAGRSKQVIRFGFINRAAEEFGKHPFIEASNIEYIK